VPIFYVYGFMGPVLYRVLDTHFCTHRGDGTHEPMGNGICIFCKTFYDLDDDIYMMDILQIIHVFMLYFFMIFYVYSMCFDKYMMLCI
jgi:hypothetical protein